MYEPSQSTKFVLSINYLHSRQLAVTRNIEIFAVKKN